MWEGSVAAIYVSPVAGKPMSARTEVKALAGRGLDGDRYCAGEGTWSRHPGTGRQVTLVEAESVEAAARDGDMALDPSDTRRNLVTRDVPLNHLVGREFTVGEVVLRGVRLAEPCTHLERLTGKKVRRPLVHRGGLRADIVAGGTIRVGDTVRGR
jgi:MOSC domain-containing protein YiiM